MSSRPTGPRPTAGPARAAVGFCWHGGPSYSLRLAGLELLFDPSFSRPGDYPAWFDAGCANPHAPSVPDYLASHRPDYLFITHGHFDHFDLRAVERLATALEFSVVGSAEVLQTCRDTLGLPPRRLLPCPVLGDGWLELKPGGPIAGRDGARVAPDTLVRAAALPSPHWFTGAEGDAAAARFAGRPERFGAMPCGGPMLGFIIEVVAGAVAPPAKAGPMPTDGVSAAARRIYLSGDSEPRGFPAGPFDVAVVSCGGLLLNPATRKREGPFLDEGTLARAACLTLRPEVLVPVHYDHPVFLTPFGPSALERELGRYPDPPRLVVPGYGAWETLVG